MRLERTHNEPRKLSDRHAARDYVRDLAPKTDAELRAEWLKHCARASRDFTYFVTFMAGFQGLHDGQLDVLAKMEAKDFGVLAASNGWGKTLFYALLVLWAGFGKHFSPPGWGQWRAAIVGHEMAQALVSHNEIELIRKGQHDGQKWCGHPAPCADGLACPQAVRHQFRPTKWLKPIKIEPNDHVAYEWTHNGSIINFESMKGPPPGAAIEGWRLNLIIFDEARLEPHLDHIVDQVFLARGVRAPGMKVLLASTPLATNYDLLGYFEKGKKGVGDWWSRQGSIRENKFLSKAQVDKIEANLDPRVRAQVLEGAWVEPPDAFFIGGQVEQCFDDTEPLVALDVWEGLLRAGGMYVGGLDAAVSEGSTADWSVLTIWDCAWPDADAPFRCIFEHVFPKGTPLTKVMQYTDLVQRYFAAYIGYDGNGPLGSELGNHMAAYDPTSYVSIRFKDKGIANEETNTYAKIDVLTNIRFFVNNRKVTYPNLPELRAQFLNYKIKDKDLVTDRFMAQVYAAWMAKDFLNLAPATGMTLREGGNLYAGHGVVFDAKNTRKDLEGKTPLQRKLIEAAENTQYIERLRQEARVAAARADRGQ